MDYENNHISTEGPNYIPIATGLAGVLVGVGINYLIQQMGPDCVPNPNIPNECVQDVQNLASYLLAVGAGGAVGGLLGKLGARRTFDTILPD